eukprot:CAMPEP_0197030028 /NCGR_PEP_ID=MMETSP1384-20130603/9343_1 /TAXON_ID=29189 /ORGANISM="Ammonia sp." /LENGTH=458 /DNA_ID=CAMNT_0042459303 /DNA_START=115 /DNA_END=1491 /DNA_ORIENTATION=+
MGNQPSDLKRTSSNARALSIRRLKSLKSSKSSTSKSSRSRSARKQSKALKKRLAEHEAFFITLHKSQYDLKNISDEVASPSLPAIAVSPADTAEHVDLSKRVVFVSLMGLYQSWRQCPSMILYSAVFLLPLKREWIYTAQKYSIHHDFGHILQDPIFVKLLKWKDTQGLLFCMKDAVLQRDLDAVGEQKQDEAEQQASKLEVAPFWRYLSLKLTALYDPVTGRKYQPLILDNSWWQSRYKLDDSQFTATPHQIFLELHLLTMKFRSISEILHQSNPSSFNIVTLYGAGNVSADNSADGANIISPSEASHKSYSLLPDRKLVMQIASTLDRDEEMAEQHEITEPELEDDEQASAPRDDEEETDNIWWISAEYDEVIENHDNDDLYDEAEEQGDYSQPGQVDQVTDDVDAEQEVEVEAEAEGVVAPQAEPAVTSNAAQNDQFEMLEDDDDEDLTDAEQAQ